MNAYNASNARTKIAAFVFSLVMSTTVLGATVLSMQSAPVAGEMPVLALERVTVTAVN